MIWIMAPPFNSTSGTILTSCIIPVWSMPMKTISLTFNASTVLFSPYFPQNHKYHSITVFFFVNSLKTQWVPIKPHTSRSFWNGQLMFFVVIKNFLAILKTPKTNIILSTEQKYLTTTLAYIHICDIDLQLFSQISRTLLFAFKDTNHIIPLLRFSFC